MLHDPKTVIGSDFDQETAEKIAPPCMARLDVDNCSKSIKASCLFDHISFSACTNDQNTNKTLFTSTPTANDQNGY